MTIQNAIDVYLRADSTLMGYIGGIGAPSKTVGRLYWMVAPEEATLPYVVYQKISDPDAQEFFSSDDGQGRIQFSTVSETKSGYAIDERLRTLLRYASGTLGGLSIWMIEPAGRGDDYNLDTKRYIWRSDYIVRCQY